MEGTKHDVTLGSPIHLCFFEKRPRKIGEWNVHVSLHRIYRYKRSWLASTYSGLCWRAKTVSRPFQWEVQRCGKKDSTSHSLYQGTEVALINETFLCQSFLRDVDDWHQGSPRENGTTAKPCYEVLAVLHRMQGQRGQYLPWEKDTSASLLTFSLFFNSQLCGHKEALRKRSFFQLKKGTLRRSHSARR